MDKNILKTIVLDQRASFQRRGSFVARTIPKSFPVTKKISVISGIRRSGKSTLLKQISRNLDGYAFLNFEDERLLDFTYKDFNGLMEVFLELYGEQNVYLFDEIQNVFGWEKFVRRLFEDGKKIFATGSNAKLLSSELATTLSGRHVKLEVFPFSFREYVGYKRARVKKNYTTREKAKMVAHLNEYARNGGFPEVVVGGNPDELKQLYQDVLIKDLLVRFKIRETKAFRDTALFLLSNVSKPISFNNLRKLLGVKSVTSVKNYVDFLEEAYLFHALFKFDFSVRKQIVNDRKIYCVDTGIINAVGFQFSENAGRIMENMVSVDLRRRGKDVFYYKGKKECDFVLRNGLKIAEAIQVAFSLADAETKTREIEGLLEVLEKFDLKAGTIITQNEEGEEKIDGRLIHIIPIWKWLLIP